jgi:hypothetical protein
MKSLARFLLPLLALVVAFRCALPAKNTPIPFKHGWVMKPAEVSEFARRVNFPVPAEVLAAYGRWNGGSVDGWLVFDAPGCTQLAVTKFLSLRIPPDGRDPGGDSALTEVQKNPRLAAQPPDRLEFLPLAIVQGSVSEQEKDNPLNCRSVLALRRDAGTALFLLDEKTGKPLKVADSLADLLGRATFWFQFIEPGK